MHNGPVRFSFDYVSSNAYLAWTQIHALAARYGRAVEPAPVLFAGLLQAHGQLGPAEVPVKAWWMCKNNLRKAALLGVPLNPPAHHPWNPLLPLRISSLPLEEEVRRRLIDAFFEAAWVKGWHPSEPEVAAAVVRKVGLEGDRLVVQAATADAKARLHEQTEAAVERGVFGVPTMEVEGELFWGYDDFPFLERYLSGEDPLDRAALAAWRDRKPSASRRLR